MSSELRTWAGATSAFFAAMRAANRSPETIRLYRHYLNQLQDTQPDPWAVTTAALTAELDRDTWSPTARKSARTAWRGFYRWAHGTGLTDEWIGQHLDPVYVPAGLPRPAPEIVVEQGKRYQQDERIPHMVMLGAHGGLRAAEMSRVHGPRDLNGDVLTVHGKGRKDRIVPIEHPPLLAWLQSLDGWALTNKHTGQPLTPGTITRMLSRALPGDWTAHNLRHRFGTETYDGTGDLLAVQELMGHASSVTTQVYVKVSARRLRAAVRAAA